jgi:hypothetical protein
MTIKPQNETQIKRAIRGTLNGLGIFNWWNLQGLGCCKGLSDIMAVMPAHIDKNRAGRIIAIEVKTEKGKLSEYQRDFLHQVNTNSGIGFVARGVDDLIENLGVKDRFII